MYILHMYLEIMKTIAIDENAYAVLLWAKENCRKIGIERPSHSDGIRWMQRKILEKS